MPTTKHTYAELLDLNAWIKKNSDAFYWQCTTRTVQESKLFPVSPYITLGYYNAWYRYPALLRKLAEHITPEELGDRARQMSCAANGISIGIASQFYIGSRQMFMDMGLLKPTDAIDDVLFVLDFTKRMNLAFHRNHAHILPSDAGHRMQLLPERTVQRFEAESFGVRPGDRLHTAVVKFLAQVSQYAFLSHCECRLGLHNSGPYRVGGNAEMLVRDFPDLAEGDFPWLDGVASEVSHNNLTLPVILSDTHFHIVDDWASFESTPAYDHNNMVAVGLYTSDYLSDGYLPVAMDNPDTLADFLEHEREVLHTATTRLWKLMAGWNRDQLLDAGALVYYSVPKDLFHIAGIYDQDDWFTIEDRALRFKPLLNDEYGRDLITELCLSTMPTQQGNEYVMNRYTDHRSTMWSQVPYSVLADDEFTETVGPIRGGRSTLPAKTGPYTTTRGKLTLAEANRLARQFTPTACAEKYRYLDDQWVKYHHDTPLAEQLYRIEQQRSPVLKDKGSGLLRADLPTKP